MNEEQRLILKMLEEGKITAAEAEALLNALKDPEATVEEERHTDLWAKIEKQGEEFAEKVEQATERFVRSLETKTELRLSDRLAKLSKMITRFPFVGQEDTYEFTDDYHGSFVESGDILCKLSTGSGRVTVRGWNEPGYRLRVTQRVRAKERETALAKLHHIDLPQDGEPLRELKVEVPSFPDVSISFDLDVPRTLIYQLDISTNNGSIAVSDLYARLVKLATVNGSLDVQGLQSERIECQTQNGSCRITHTKTDVFTGRTGVGSFRLIDLQSENVNCMTSSGSIWAEPVVRGDAEYNLETTAGSVHVDLGDQREIKASFDLRTSVGRIMIPERDMEGAHMDRQSGGWHMVGTSPGFESGPNRLRLTARTGSGSIRIAGGGGGQD
ncbi:MAG: DUF4097 domain-containing protein [Firmicutes bacterium]|jgi:DUF4097 and DUF4098 domain-containing protein YvlB|nr:DUF4097 domain-containing protein [Bacillota bacterium]